MENNIKEHHSDVDQFSLSRKQIHKILDIGMGTRQNQLSGHEGRSGKEIINEWINENLKEED